MQSNFKVKGMLFTLSAKLKTTGVRFPNSQKEDKGLHNHYRIMVKTALGKAIFDFYGSHQDYINGVKEMKEQDLKHALYCFVSDACSAQNGFEDFCNEFGYNEDSRAAERIYKQCKIMLAKYTRICDADIYEVLNEINE
jgi:isopropylmalate/homocitrate/citramalate synthase